MPCPYPGRPVLLPSLPWETRAAAPVPAWLCCTPCQETCADASLPWKACDAASPYPGRPLLLPSLPWEALAVALPARSLKMPDPAILL
jgi:hypothetical protein